MCTITFVPLSNSSYGFVLTSNRDEAVVRETLTPDVYVEDGVRLFYPKDIVAGGTWIGISEHKRLVCLMNGGFEKHRRKPPYLKSRGLVVKDLLLAVNLLPAFSELELGYVEPFTAIVVEWKKGVELYRLVWDGKKRHQEKLPFRNHIWASSFLYSPEIRKKREQDFRKFCRGGNPGPVEMMKFHSSEGEGAIDGLVIDRGLLKTCSITQVLKSSDDVRMIYKDLLKEGAPVFQSTVIF